MCYAIMTNVLTSLSLFTFGKYYDFDFFHPSESRRSMSIDERRDENQDSFSRNREVCEQVVMRQV